MATSWYICNYVRKDPYPGRPGRVMEIDNYTNDIRAAGGNWRGLELNNGYALIKVVAPQQVLDMLAALPGFHQIPLSSLDLTLSELTQAQRNMVQAIVEALGFSTTEIRDTLGSSLLNVTLRQVFRFITSRKHRPRFDALGGVFVYDGATVVCEDAEKMDLELTE